MAGCYRTRANVADGSFASLWPSAGDFRSTPNNGHCRAAPAGVHRARQRRRGPYHPGNPWQSRRPQISLIDDTVRSRFAGAGVRRRSFKILRRNAGPGDFGPARALDTTAVTEPIEVSWYRFGTSQLANQLLISGMIKTRKKAKVARTPREARVCDMHRAGTWTGSEFFVFRFEPRVFLARLKP